MVVHYREFVTTITINLHVPTNISDNMFTCLMLMLVPKLSQKNILTLMGIKGIVRLFRNFVRSILNQGNNKTHLARYRKEKYEQHS